MPKLRFEKHQSRWSLSTSRGWESTERTEMEKGYAGVREDPPAQIGQWGSRVCWPIFLFSWEWPCPWSCPWPRLCPCFWGPHRYSDKTSLAGWGHSHRFSWISIRTDRHDDGDGAWIVHWPGRHASTLPVRVDLNSILLRLFTFISWSPTFVLFLGFFSDLHTMASTGAHFLSLVTISFSLYSSIIRLFVSLTALLYCPLSHFPWQQSISMQLIIPSNRGQCIGRHKPWWFPSYYDRGFW